MLSLYLAYWANIFILLPIAIPTIFKIFPTDQGRFVESEGWRVLVGGLWLGILTLSVLGLFHPLRYSPVLLLQLIYKTAWLAVYMVPRITRGDRTTIPWGIGGSFTAIILIWPLVIPWSYLLNAE